MGKWQGLPGGKKDFFVGFCFVYLVFGLLMCKSSLQVHLYFRTLALLKASSHSKPQILITHLQANCWVFTSNSALQGPSVITQRLLTNNCFPSSVLADHRLIKPMQETCLIDLSHTIKPGDDSLGQPGTWSCPFWKREQNSKVINCPAIWGEINCLSVVVIP